MAGEIGGSDLAAGLPQAVGVLGAGGAAVVMSRFARRRGRSQSLTYGASVAVLGCLAVIASAVSGALPGVLLGTCLLGAGNAAVMLSRYAAPELSPAISRPRAMASVLAATTVGAVIGPNLLGTSAIVGRLTHGPDLVGAYMLAAVVFLAAAIVVVRARTVPPSAAVPPTRSTGRIKGRVAGPKWTIHTVIGLTVLAVANLVMVGVMTMAPLQMSHHGSGFGLIGLVVSAHIAGMFAPSMTSGRLTERLGGEVAAIVALMILWLACGCAALVGQQPLPLGAAMLLLGVGWNLAIVSGGDLLTCSVAQVDRLHREGLGELAMAIAATIGGAGSGAVMADKGYPSVAVVGGALAGIALVAVVASTTRVRRDEALSRMSSGETIPASRGAPPPDPTGSHFRNGYRPSK